jgi:hypothetical protein
MFVLHAFENESHEQQSPSLPDYLLYINIVKEIKMKNFTLKKKFYTFKRLTTQFSFLVQKLKETI